MLRSMYAGVAGLKTHQTKMDVIGNNIANVNTTSYKSQSISFSDLMYQTTQNASGATSTTGGVNARQIGLGAKSGAISTAISTQGATQTTNNPFDLMITGNSFFVVNNGTSNEYTRDGSFYVDGSGNLAMQSTGYYVYGWTAQTDATTGVTSINQNSGLGKLQVMNKKYMTYEPEATTQAVISGNIDAKDANVTSTAGKTVTLEFYDNLGYLYTGEFTLKNDSSDSHKYTMTLTDVLDSTGKTLGATELAKIHFGADGGTGKSITINYDPSTGAIKSMTDGTSSAVIASNKAVISFDNNTSSTSDPGGFKNITVDFTTTTNVNSSGTSTIQASKGDLSNNNTGRKLGTMTGITVATDGKINATYSNGQTRLLGQIAVAEFANASGLEKQGDNLYSSTLNSGDPTIQDVTSDAGSISTGVLEMSNVDLSNEFTNMITAQRGFQANSRIITVSDTLLEELTNLKR